MLRRISLAVFSLVASCFVSAAGAAEPAPNTLTPEEKAEGFRLLFDGQTTDGWRGYNMEKMPPGWKVIDGVLTRVAGGAGGKGAGGGDDIITNDEFDNFELRLQWRVGKGENSGILYRVKEGAATSWHVAPEMQVLDDKGWGEEERRHHAGALYDLYAPSHSVVKSPNQWNDVRLVVDGNHVEHWLNGEKVVEVELNSDDWKERVAKSKFKDKPDYAKATKGHICLQDHSGKVEYRTIRLKKLGEKK